MAVTLDATVGGASSNSFATVEEADAYLATRLNSGAWTGTDPKAVALIEATRTLSALAWQGYRTDDVQALSWPRTGVVNPDASLDAPAGAWTGMPEYDDDVIPQRVKDATCELALEFLRAGTTDIAGQDDAAGIILETVGPLTTEWESAGVRPQGLQRYPRVIGFIAPLLGAGTGQAEVVRA